MYGINNVQEINVMRKLYFVLAIALLAGIVLISVGCSNAAATTTTTLPPGTPTANSGDTVEVDYTLKLSNGTVYQTTVGTGNHFDFTLGTGEVIAGFDAAVNGMYVGQTKTVKIPAAQAYGTQKSTSNPLAGQDLTFVITLLAINPAQ
jgi:FKBP-type peptidyl-prolyl cis-trans isomerase